MNSNQYTFQDLGSGAWAAIARKGAGAGANSGLVDTGRSALVFDTAMTPVAAADLRSAARLLVGKEPLEVVNSHWHLAHCVGNRVFGGCTIRTTAPTQRLLGRTGGALSGRVNSPAWTRAVMDVESRREAEVRPLYREELAVEAAAGRDLAETRDALELRLPDETFAGRYIYDGKQDVMLVEGAGHGESDVILWAPGAEAMFTGDLVVVETHPDLRSASVDRWLEALGRIEAAQPKFLVPGHGPVAGLEACSSLRNYLMTVVRMAREPGRMEMPEEYVAWNRPSLFARNIEALRSGPARAPS